MVCVIDVIVRWLRNLNLCCFYLNYQNIYVSLTRPTVRVCVNTAAHSRDNCCRGSVCVCVCVCVCVALVTLHAKRMHLIILSSVACLYHNFMHYLKSGTIFGE